MTDRVCLNVSFCEQMHCQKHWVCTWLVLLMFWLGPTKSQPTLSPTSISTGDFSMTRQSFRLCYVEVRTASITLVITGLKHENLLEPLLTYNEEFTLCFANKVVID